MSLSLSELAQEDEEASQLVFSVRVFTSHTSGRLLILNPHPKLRAQISLTRAAASLLSSSANLAGGARGGMHAPTRGLVTPSKAAASPAAPPPSHAWPVSLPCTEVVGNGRTGVPGSVQGGGDFKSQWPDGWVWPEEKPLLSLRSKGGGSEGRKEDYHPRGGDEADVDVGGGVRAGTGEQGDAVQLPGLGERGASKSPTPSPSQARSPFHE